MRKNILLQISGAVGLFLFLTSQNALSAPNYECEIKIINTGVNSAWFSVGDHMKISTSDSEFILPEFTRADGSLSPWNMQSQSTFIIQSDIPDNFQIIFVREFVSGDFVEKNTVEIEKASPSSDSFGAWVHFSRNYGQSLRKELIKMYATCTTE